MMEFHAEVHQWKVSSDASAGHMLTRHLKRFAPFCSLRQSCDCLLLRSLPPQVADDYTVIGRSLFKKETNLQLFLGLKVTLSTGETGVIEGGFGQSGKFKIRVPGEGSAEA